MSDHKKEAKAASAAKMQRMGLKLDDGSKSFTDERGGSPFEGLNSGNAGKMPITPSRFKRGGKVAHVVGKHAAKNLGKSARKGREHHSGLDGVNRVGRMMNTEDISDNIPPQQIPMPTARPKNLNPVRPQIATNVGQFNRNPAAGYPLQRGMPGRGDGALNLPYSGSTKKPMPYIPPEEGDPGSPGYGDKHGGRIHHARGGIIGATPAERKKVVGALASRKKKEGLPSAPPKEYGINKNVKANVGLLSPMKKGGAAKHTDEAEDKKLMHKILKPKAFKAEGGRTMHHADCSCKMCSGGMAERAHRATGGRTKGKTNVNIIISPQSGGQGQGVLGAGVGMGQPPVPPMMPPMPPQMPPMPPGGGMPPAGGAPQLPPQLMAALAARGGAGGPPMPRKSGGRVGQGMPKYQEKDYGSGSGLGRLEKKKWPTANGTE